MTQAQPTGTDDPGPPAPLTAHGSVLQTQIANGKIGLWLFLGSEVMFFTGLIGAYIVLRFAQTDRPAPANTLNVHLTAVNTFLLIFSSVTLVWALQSYQKHQPMLGKIGLLATTLIGALFVAVQAFEYCKLYESGMRPDVNLFGSCFYVMTAFHGTHVAAGVVAMAVLTIMAFGNKFGPKYAQHAPYRVDGALLALCRSGLDCAVCDRLPRVARLMLARGKRSSIGRRIDGLVRADGTSALTAARFRAAWWCRTPKGLCPQYGLGCR